MADSDHERSTVSDVLRRLIDARREDLRAHLDARPTFTAEADPLPGGTQLLACLIDAAGMRDSVAITDRSFQRQKAGKRTALVADAPIKALARLFIDTARPSLLGQQLDPAAMELFLGQQLTAACASWDRVASAARETLERRAAQHAALRLLMIELAVRRAALFRVLGAKSCTPWFAFERHPFNAGLAQVLAHHRVEIGALRRELELAGVSVRAFESWRHEGKPASIAGIDAIGGAIAKLSKKRPRKREATQVVVSLLRCARMAVLARRGLDEALGARAVRDLFAGHQRVAECVFDTLREESVLAVAAIAGILATSPADAIEHLRRIAAFDPDARRMLEPGMGWLDIPLRTADTAEDRSTLAKLGELFRVAPIEDRIRGVHALIVVGMSDPKARAQILPELERGALADMVLNGPRARTFGFLLPNVEARLPWRGVAQDLRALALDPTDHLLELIARGDVLAMIPHLIASRGYDASPVSGRDLTTDLHRFDVEDPS